jgi:hypothetical protein
LNSEKDEKEVINQNQNKEIIGNNDKKNYKEFKINRMYSSNLSNLIFNEEININKNKNEDEDEDENYNKEGKGFLRFSSKNQLL